MSGIKHFRIIDAKAAVWFTIAKQNQFSVQNLLYSTEDVPTELLAAQKAIQDILKWQNSHKQNIREVVSFMKAGMLLISEQPWTRLTADQYDEVRIENSMLFGTKCPELPALWPPSAQTISRILGHGTWNSAMQSLGISINKGKPVGSGKYSAEDFKRAISDFVLICGSNSTYPSNALYEEWRNHSSWEYPSLASLRNFYGSWSRALEVNPEFKISKQLHLWEDPQVSNKTNQIQPEIPNDSYFENKVDWDY